MADQTDSRLSDREPLAHRVVAEHHADVAEAMRQADRNLQRRHKREEPNAVTPKFESLDAAVKEYVDALDARPNAWGQHLTRFGQSHDLLREAHKAFGGEVFQAAFDVELKRRIAAQKAREPKQ